MTTIVYDHKNKQIAVDSRATASGLITSDDEQKWHVDADGAVWFLSGCISDYDLLFDCFKNGDRAYDLPEIPDAIAFVVRDGCVSIRGVTDKGEAWTQKLTGNRCLGSGSTLALAALDFGCKAVDAVKYAATRDCYSGGAVHCFDVDKMEFVQGEK
jgi:20S proteasome alpha/beta subunit